MTRDVKDDGYTNSGNQQNRQFWGRVCHLLVISTMSTLTMKTQTGHNLLYKTQDLTGTPLKENLCSLTSP